MREHPAKGRIDRAWAERLILAGRRNAGGLERFDEQPVLSQPALIILRAMRPTDQPW